MRLALTVGFILTLALGCGPRTELMPAPSAQRLSDRTGAAVAEVAGVRVIVDPNQWDGQPADLTRLIPLHVTIDNQSGKPLRLRYNEFKLVTDSSVATALPPYQIAPTVGSPRSHPTFHSQRFWIAPHQSSHFAHMYPWRDPFPLDHGYYRYHYGLWGDRPPTQDMIERAIPEGVVEEGGMIAGFLYFRQIDPDITQLRFTFELIDAKTAESFGEVSIPFEVVET